MSSSIPRVNSFKSKGGVEVFPLQPITTLGGESIDPPTLAARDSLALQEVGRVPTFRSDVSEDIDVDEYVVTGEEGEEIGVDEYAGSLKSPGGGIDRRKSLRIGLLLALVLTIVLATVLTSDKRKQNRAASSGIVAGAEEESFVAEPTDPLELTPEFQILKPYVNPPSKLLDPETSQGKAFQQLLAEDIAEDKEFRVTQRFAMMVVYFSMGGENWAWQSGWSNFSEDECDWHGVAICRFRDGRKIAAGLQIRK
jgi:hypothetical protein